MIRQKKLMKKQAGFSLVELMVGLVIGLLATLVVMQTFSAFEGQKRSTSGTADAQTNGTIAMMQLQRSLQMAGYGLPMPNADFENNILRCTNMNNIFPVEVQDGINGNAGDRIISRYGNAPAGGVPIEVDNATNPVASPGMVVTNNIGCGSDLEMDLARYNSIYRDPSDPTDDKAPNNVLLYNGTSCGIAEIAEQPTNNVPAGQSYIRLAALPAGVVVNTETKLACTGGYGDHVFEVVNNELLVDGDPIVSEVISMHAQYGVSNAADNNEVTAWVDASGSWAAPSVSDRNRIKAVRVALVLRNGLKEKTQVTTAAPRLSLWTSSGAENIDIGVAHLPDWQNYRYRVFGATVPLRNIIWSRKALE